MTKPGTHGLLAFRYSSIAERLRQLHPVLAAAPETALRTTCQAY